MIDVSRSGHYVGDCRELLRQLPDGCVQTCVTSPPYWGLRDYGVDGQIGLEATPEEYVAISSGYKAGNKNRSSRADHGGVNDHHAPQKFGVPWSDTDGLRNRRSVWTTISQPYSGAHFATFPPALIEPCVLAGAPVGGVVLDPFFGSGTTGEVAEKHGRKWIGFDINPAYEALQKERTAQRSLILGDATP